MKIASWNVNSLRVRLPQVLSWLENTKPDVLALQETKIIDEEFPAAEIQAAGYHVSFSGQKTYNGMAILSLKPLTEIVTQFTELNDPQRRVLGVTIDDVRILNLYVPNGESVNSEKYQYKLNWLRHLKLHLEAELKKYNNIVLLGDFNIAPEPIDVHDPNYWDGRVLFSRDERNAFQEILALGFVDCFRKNNPSAQDFSWWDYRLNSFKRNLGLRIDHILASKNFSTACVTCYIDKHPRAHERPSDHAVVVAEFKR